MLTIDTREKRWEHIRKWLEANQIPYSVEKVPCGDYTLRGKPQLAVERKRNLEEISYNLFNRNDKHRFMREVRRAAEQGVRLVLLIEHGNGVRSLQDLAAWQDPKTKVPGTALAARLETLRVAYGVKTVFCDKPHAAQTILQLLRGDSA